MKFIIEPLNDKECRIVDIDCSDMQGISLKELVVPAKVEEDGKLYRVKEVGKQVCFTCKNDSNIAKYVTLRRLEKIIFSEGIEAVEAVMCPRWINNADERGNTETLKEVVFPSTLKRIGRKSFEYCVALSNINVPEGVEIIEGNAFNNCKQLKLFQWPKSLRKVDVSAFCGMDELVDLAGNPTFDLNIPETIEEINGSFGYRHVIRNCKVSTKCWPILDSSEITRNIVKIEVPEGVTKILGKYKYTGYISLPTTLEEIGEESFYASEALKDFNGLPDSIRVIGNKAFKDCKLPDHITEIKIPSPEVKVGKSAFSNVKNPLQIVGDVSTIAALLRQPGVFNGTKIEVMHIPEGAMEVDVNQCKFLKELTIPSTVKNIDRISHCPNIKDIIIPDSVISINEINNNSGLVSLKLSNNLEELKFLGNCENLKGELALPETLKKLKKNPTDRDSVFENLHSQIKASPKTWQLICTYNFALRGYDPENKEIKIPEGVETIASKLLYDSKLERVYLPSTIKKVETEVFRYCEQLKSVEFDEAEGNEKTETEFAPRMFEDLNSLETITFPIVVKDYGFRERGYDTQQTTVMRCKNLKSVVFPCEDPKIANYPLVLGKLCDWYVPESMVTFVKDWIEKMKQEHPELKGIGAKSIKPLSKLGIKKQPINRAAPKRKQQPLTQPIKMHREVRIEYEFPVNEEDASMLTTSLMKDVIGIKYMKQRLSECAFSLAGHSRSDLVLDTNVESATKEYWDKNEKNTVLVNLSNNAAMPEGVSETLAKKLISHSGDLSKVLCSEIPTYEKGLPKSKKTIVIEFWIRLNYEFMIGEKEKFNVNKIRNIEIREGESLLPFAFSYNGRFIPVTSYDSNDDDMIRVSSYNENKYEWLKDSQIDGIKITAEGYKQEKIPFLQDIIDLMNGH